MQKQFIFFLISLIYIVTGYGNGNGNGNYQNSNCKRFENKVYQLNVTFPGEETGYALIRLLPNGLFDQLSSSESGNNSANFGVSVSFGDHIGYYKCLRKNDVRLTGLAYAYQTPNIPGLQNGAILLLDYYLNFYNNDKSSTGSIQYGFFQSGTNPFATNAQAITTGPIGTVTGQLLKFKKYFDLSDTTTYQ